MSNINTQSKINKQSTRYKKENRSDKRSSLLLLLPIAVILVVVPLLVRVKEYYPHLSTYSWFSYENTMYDHFLYYKQWWFVAISAVMLCILLYRKFILHRQMKLKTYSILLPFAVYLTFVLVSSLFGGHLKISFSGGYDMFQSVWAVLGYGVVIFYCYTILKSEEDFRFVTRCFIIGTLILTGIGFFQFIGHDFFGTDLASILVTGVKNAINVNLEKGRVYTTLFNPNYVGVYTALLIPIFTTLLLLNKKYKLTFLYIIIDVLLIICSIGSKSLAGFIGIVISFVCILILLRKYIIRYYYVTIPLFTFVILSLSLINQYTDGFMTNRLRGIFHLKKAEYNLKSIETLDECIQIKYKDYEINVTINPSGELAAYNEDNLSYPLLFDQETSSYLFEEAELNQINIKPFVYNSRMYFTVTIEGKEWNFTNQEGDNTYHYINLYGKLDKIKTADSLLFEGYETFASSRFYLWSRTLPLLKDHIVLGSGQDTFTIQFPQQDHVNIDRFLNNQIITKPHSLYLQIAVESGVISLIAFLVFYIMYFIQSVKLYYRGLYNTFSAQLGLGIFIGSISYMVVGLTNDATITVAPLFWTLIGIGLAANKKAKDDMSETK